MKFTFDHDLHIHSTLSRCCYDEKQTPQAILSYAKKEGLKTICLTNHFWYEAIPTESSVYAEQNFPHVKSALPLPEEEGIRFLFGCETDLNRHGVPGITKEKCDDFDFVIVPITHFHMNTNVPPEEKDTPEACAASWEKRLRCVLDMDLPFHKIGLAHLACRLISKNDRAKQLSALNALDEEVLHSLFRKAAGLGCGIELNLKDMTFSPEEEETILRPFFIAKEEGCKFYLASDAHAVTAFPKMRPTFDAIIEKLSLTEEDKFRI